VEAKVKPAPDEAALAKAKRDSEEKAKAKLEAQEKLAAQAKAKAEAEERAKRRTQAEQDERTAAAPTRAEADERARKAQQEEEERLAVARARQEAADRQAKAAAAKAATPPPAPKRIEELSSQAMAAYRRGELLSARNLWTEIVTHGQATSSDKALAYNNMAISYCQSGDEANCERMYIASLRADRNYQVGAGEREGAHFKRAYDRAARAVRGQY
jgi:membrane protein involved in colicin uptake